jgi:hypothetical protein
VAVSDELLGGGGSDRARADDDVKSHDFLH